MRRARANWASGPAGWTSAARRGVIDRLRLFFNRPLSDAARPQLFAIAVALIVGAALVLPRFDDAGPAPKRTSARAVTVVPADPPVAPTPSPTSTTVPLSEEGTPAPSEPSGTDIAGAKRAARGFLAGYLPYTYARAHARDIQAVTPQ